MIYQVQLARPIAWRIDLPWQPIELRAFGLRLLSLWTQLEQDDLEISPGHQLLKTNEGWTLLRSRSLVLEGEVPRGRVMELFAQLAQRFRWVSGQASISRTFASWTELTASAYSTPTIPEPEPVGKSWLNRAFFAAPLTPTLAAEAGRDTSVDTPFLLLADAAEALSDGDSVRAILYSAFAAETCSRMRVRQLSERALGSTEHHHRVALVGGEPRDDVLAALLKQGDRNADMLLHELPTYLERRSLQRQAPELWRQWKRLKSSRNKLAHEGLLELEDEAHLPVSLAGATDALRTAVHIFEWWGLAASRFLESTSAADAGADLHGFFRPG